MHRETVRLIARAVKVSAPLHGRRILNVRKTIFSEGRAVIIAPRTQEVQFKGKSPTKGFTKAFRTFVKASKAYKKVFALLLAGCAYTEMYNRSFSGEDYSYFEEGGMSVSDITFESLLVFMGYDDKVDCLSSQDDKFVNKIINVLYAVVPGLYKWMGVHGYDKQDIANASMLRMFGLKQRDWETIDRAL